jgi:hypothetical protein
MAAGNPPRAAYYDGAAGREEKSAIVIVIMRASIPLAARLTLGTLIGAGILSCTVTRHGTLARRSDSLVISVSVAVRGDQAIIRGVNTVTGEQLVGRLTPARQSRWQNPDDRIGFPPIGGSPAAVPGGARAPLVGAEAMYMVGDLHGDRGTVLRCTAQVRKTLRMPGEGVCYALSGDKDSIYELEF